MESLDAICLHAAWAGRWIRQVNRYEVDTVDGKSYCFWVEVVEKL